MRIHIYFSLYIILWSLLYYLGFISYNPLFWLYIAILAIIIIEIYLIYYGTRIKLIIYTFIVMIMPKIIMIILIDKNNVLNGFYFGIILFIIYLYFINYDLYDIYYAQTTEKILNETFKFYLDE